MQCQNDLRNDNFLLEIMKYSQTSNMKHTQFQNINSSRLVLQLSVPNPLKPNVKSRMKM